MRFFNDGFGVHDKRAAEQHQRNGHQESRLIDGGKKRFEIKTNGIVRRHKFYARSEAPLSVIKILHGRKFEIGHYDFVARAAKIKA